MPETVIGALLSALHILALGVGLTSVVIRGQALGGRLDDEGWRRLLAADTGWGIAAALWIATGLARVFLGGKDPDFYWSNGFFWVKMTLFLAVFALEIAPMVTFIRVRQARGRGAALPSFPVARFQRINAIEVGLIVTIVVVAAFMARGVWLF